MRSNKTTLRQHRVVMEQKVNHYQREMKILIENELAKGILDGYRVSIWKEEGEEHERERGKCVRRNFLGKCM